VTALKVGDVIEVNEPDYKYGTGKLILRVTRLGRRMRESDGEWLDLEGMPLRPDGTQLAHQPRPVLVRVNAVRVRPSPGARS
jgi:hypothetical protein